MHELLSEFLEDINESENDNDVIEDIDEVNDSDSTLLANVTLASSINLGDIRKMLSTPEKGKPISSTTIKAYFKSEIEVNSKACRKVSAHITCYVSNIILSSQHSLVEM